MEETEILDAVVDGVAKLDHNWTVQYINRAGRAMLGSDLDPVGRNHWEVFPEAAAEGSPFRENYVRTMLTREKTKFISFYGKPLHLWVEVQVSPAANGIIVFFRDITTQHLEQEERASLARQLKVSSDRLRLAQNVGRIASWEWDVKANTLLWDETSSLVYGRPASEMVGYEQIFSYIHPEDRAKVEAALQPALQGIDDYRCDFRVIWPDGSTHWIEGWGRSEPAEDGEITCIVGINVDVTERKQTDAALLQSEKLAAVGRMASSIAHEINNPLEAITNLLYLAKTSQDLLEARSYLDGAELELRRVSAITSQTLRFHRQQTRARFVTFQQIILGIFTGQHSRLLNAKVSVKERDRASGLVLCFDGEIRQVLINLISNAIDAMQGDGGVLFLRARSGHNWHSGEAGLVITVADTGTGLQAAARDKLFDAFYTTKGAAGNGLGLWISRNITDRHSGKLTFRSSRASGRSGTVFTLFLPDVSDVLSFGTS